MKRKGGLFMQRHEVIAIAESLYLQALQAKHNNDFDTMISAIVVHLPRSDKSRIDEVFEEWKKTRAK
jgi:hypothetical protein